MPTRKNILITGGTGMIGTRLTERLLAQGYSVAYLSRTRKNAEVKTFLWDPSSFRIDENALLDVDAVIHLAGAGIADKRWTTRRKNEILLSRTESTRLLNHALRNTPNDVKTLVSASGSSFYGLENRERPYAEEDAPGDDFMARVTVAWENEVDQMGDRLRIVKLRTGVVLNDTGIAMKKLTLPIKFFVGAPLGSGQQYVNWIHIDDLCSMYEKALEDEAMQGVYNAVAPHPVTNQELTGELAHALHRPLWLPPVPGFVVKIIAGEVADVVLNGGSISCRKIEDAGFVFHYSSVRSALEDLLGA